MFSLLLAIIYVSFISLGLPDSLLGSAWPVMRLDLDAPTSYAGGLSMIIAFGTIISSLFSDRLTTKLGTGKVTALSVSLTAIALFGFSVSQNIAMLCVFAVPYGIGAGAVDAALNNYVALHYSSRHMSWLHCFWGVGASVSPYIMSFCLTHGFGWRSGYRSVFILQVVLSAVLFASLPMWKKNGGSDSGKEERKPLKLSSAVKIKGVPFIMLTFFCYCAMESSTGLWASTYLTDHRGITAETAAMFASLFYLGITGGRFISGFVSAKMGDTKMIRIGSAIAAVGIVMVMLPVGIKILSLAGLIVIGIGCAPIYPSIIHATPDNFGRENSQSIIGIQMASAYTGTTFMPPVFGLLADKAGVWLFPFFLCIFAAVMFMGYEIVVKKTSHKTA